MIRSPGSDINNARGPQSAHSDEILQKIPSKHYPTLCNMALNLRDQIDLREIGSHSYVASAHPDWAIGSSSCHVSTCVKSMN